MPTVALRAEARLPVRLLQTLAQEIRHTLLEEVQVLFTNSQHAAIQTLAALTERRQIQEVLPTHQVVVLVQALAEIILDHQVAAEAAQEQGLQAVAEDEDDKLQPKF